MSDNLWGPLGGLIGVWKGDKGKDVAPSDDRGVEKNSFHEVIRFEGIGPVNNHEQMMYGLRYSTTATRIGEAAPFHEELGYWLWDFKTRQVMRCFMVPRGVTVIAGGTVEPHATKFTLKATLGSPTYGICSNQYLDLEFKTVAYTLTVTVSQDTFEYEEDTVIQIKGQKEPFHHTDANRLTRA